MPPERLHDVPDDAERKRTQDVSVVPEEKPTSQPPTVPSSEQLHDVENGVEIKHTQEAAAAQEQPAPARPTATPPQPLRADTPPENSAVEQDRVMAPETPLPDASKEPSSGKPGDLPPPEQLDELKAVQDAAPSPPKPIAEQKPQATEVEVRPAEVAIVTEKSAGPTRTGGAARVVGIYLGKINERVQQFKINPQSRLSGVVVLKYIVGIDGSLLSKEVTSSSGFRALDEAALATIDRAVPFPHIPVEVSLKPLVFTQSFRFIIR
jgi:protein TonB